MLYGSGPEIPGYRRRRKPLHHDRPILTPSADDDRPLSGAHSLTTTTLAPKGPPVAIIGPVIRVELERIEALELLGMTLAHLNDAEAKPETSPRVPLLMAIRDKLGLGLREEL